MTAVARPLSRSLTRILTLYSLEILFYFLWFLLFDSVSLNLSLHVVPYHAVASTAHYPNLVSLLPLQGPRTALPAALDPTPPQQVCVENLETVSGRMK